MKLPVIIIGSLLGACLAVPFVASADRTQLGEPIVELMPHVKELRAQLGLTARQVATLDAWIVAAPARRRALETEALRTRQALRDAILAGADRMTHDDLKSRLAATQTRLVEMRSLCVRMLRQTLNEDQFARVVARYQAD